MNKYVLGSILFFVFSVQAYEVIERAVKAHDLEQVALLIGEKKMPLTSTEKEKLLTLLETDIQKFQELKNLTFFQRLGKVKDLGNHLILAASLVGTSAFMLYKGCKKEEIPVPSTEKAYNQWKIQGKYDKFNLVGFSGQAGDEHHPTVSLLAYHNYDVTLKQRLLCVGGVLGLVCAYKAMNIFFQAGIDKAYAKVLAIKALLQEA